MSVDLNLVTTNYAGVEGNARSVLDGMVSTNWIQALIARGFGWHIEVGNFDTGITGGGAGTVMDLDQPEFGISVPAGSTIIPFDIQIVARPGLQTTDSHVTDCLLAVDRTAAWAGDGTVTSQGCIYYTTTYQLAKDFCQLIYSLGGTAKITTKKFASGLSYNCIGNLSNKMASTSFKLSPT